MLHEGHERLRQRDQSGLIRNNGSCSKFEMWSRLDDIVHSAADTGHITSGKNCLFVEWLMQRLNACRQRGGSAERIKIGRLGNTKL